MTFPGSFKQVFYKSPDKDSSHISNIVVSRTSVIRKHVPAIVYTVFGVAVAFFHSH